MQFVIQAMLVKSRIRSRTFFSWSLCSLVFFQPAAENVIKHYSPHDEKKIKDCIEKTQALVTEHLFNIIQKNFLHYHIEEITKLILTFDFKQVFKVLT